MSNGRPLYVTPGPPVAAPAISPGWCQNLVGWWRADKGLVDQFWVSLVMDWVLDGSGHRPAVSQSDPLFNNLPSTVYTGSEYWTGAAGLAQHLQNRPSTMVTVARRGSNGAFHTMASVGDSQSGNNYIWWTLDSGNKLFYRRLLVGNQTDIGNTNVLAPNAFSAAVTYDQNETQIYLNSATDGSAAPNTTDPIDCDQYTIGALGRSTFNNFFVGAIAEHIVFDAALSSNALLAVFAYLNVRYALP